jgi:hypothetical protein
MFHVLRKLALCALMYIWLASAALLAACGDVSGGPGWNASGQCFWAGYCGPELSDWCYGETCEMGGGGQGQCFPVGDITYCTNWGVGCYFSGCWNSCICCG